ncbi:hypothetical protein P7C70_g1371, partial [Phenoliferia sp. Uapishka_3]
MAISSDEAELLELARAKLSAHESINPSSPGKWSVRRQPYDSKGIYWFPPLDSLKSHEANAAAIQLLEPFVEKWTMLEQALVGRKAENKFKGTSIRLEENDPQAFLYAGVSLYWAKKDLQRAESLIKLGLKHTGIIGQRNPVWAYAVLARVLRDQGKSAECTKVEDGLVKFLKDRPALFPPGILRYNLLGPGETSTNITERLNIASTASGDGSEQRIIGTAAAMNKHAEKCKKCGDYGMLRTLSKCGKTPLSYIQWPDRVLTSFIALAKCRQTFYCSRTCQVNDWKGWFFFRNAGLRTKLTLAQRPSTLTSTLQAHKVDCLSINKRVEKMEEGALIAGSRNDLSVYDQFSEFANALGHTVSILNLVCRPSALTPDFFFLQLADVSTSAFGSITNAATHIFVVECEWVPTGRQAIDYFNVRNGVLWTGDRVERHWPGFVGKIDADIARQPKLQGKYVCLRTLIVGSEAGKASFTRSWFLSFPEGKKWTKDPEWLKLLLAKKIRDT